MKYYLIHGIDSIRKPFMENQFQRFGIPAEDVTWITYPNKTDYLPYKPCINSKSEKKVRKTGLDPQTYGLFQKSNWGLNQYTNRAYA